VILDVQHQGFLQRHELSVSQLNRRHVRLPQNSMWTGLFDFEPRLQLIRISCNLGSILQKEIGMNTVPRIDRSDGRKTVYLLIQTGVL
jgi:hypothetical protein